MGDVILLSKKDLWSKKAGDLAEMLLGDRLHWVTGAVGDPFPKAVERATPKWLISFLSPWIVPGTVLENAGMPVNFHPASSHYPGTGCYNFALYEGSKSYGAVCHFMKNKVDTGDIIDERRFTVFASDTVETLKYRTMIVMLSMFHDFLQKVVRDETPRKNDNTWTRKPFTKAQLNRLRDITPDMPAEEVLRRVRATTYPGYPGAKINIGNVDFLFPVPARPPVA